jgi:hypothetical protein
MGEGRQTERTAISIVYVAVQLYEILDRIPSEYAERLVVA